MTDASHSPDFSDRQDALRAMAYPRDGEGEFWNRQREFTYGPIEDPVLRRSIWSAFGSLCRNLTNAIRSRLQ